MNGRLILALILTAPALVWAEAPVLKDFAHGLTLSPEPDLPLQEITLPDSVYAGVTRADLGDLRVYNAAAVVVQHALCHQAPDSEPVVREQPLHVFALQRAQSASSTGERIELRTTEGTEIQVQQPQIAAGGTSSSAKDVSAYIMDAHELQEPMRALRLNWETLDGASEVQVRVETSEDLDHWATLIAQATLLSSVSADKTLERSRLTLPEGHYRYLRIERSDGGAPPRLNNVTAEVLLPASETAPVLFVPEPAPTPDSEGNFQFETRRMAPVHTALVQPPAANMALRIALESRATPDAAWHQRWSGEISSITGSEQSRQYSEIRFAASSDPYWRLRMLQGSETLGTARPTLQLGYHPARLRFLAQGEGPYTLAYGSGRAEPAAAQNCESLLAGMRREEVNRLLGRAGISVAAVARFGGAEALQPVPERTPLRVYVLWGTLIAGAALLAGMAFSLLKRVRAGSGGS